MFPAKRLRSSAGGSPSRIFGGAEDGGQRALHFMGEVLDVTLDVPFAFQLFPHHGQGPGEFRNWRPPPVGFGLRPSRRPGRRCAGD